MADSKRDYLTPFAEINKKICDGVNERRVLNMITRALTEALDIKGSFIKIRSPEGEGLEGDRGKSLDVGRGDFRVRFSKSKKLQILSSYGLSQDFIYSEDNLDPNSIFHQIPEDTIFIQNIDKQKDQLLDSDYETMKSENITAYLMFPIEVEQEKVAFVGLFDSKEGDLTKEDVKFARALSSRGVSAFIRKREIERLLHIKRLFLSSFQEISNAINSTLNINKVLELAVQKITEALGIKGTQIRLLDSKTQKLKLAASFGLSQEFLKIGPIRAKRKVEAEYSLNTKHSGDIVVIDDIKTDPRVQYKEAMLAENINKMLTMPLHVKGKNIGELTIFTVGNRSFSEEEINYADTVAQQCAFAIENARMYQRVKYEYQQLLEDFGYDGSS